MVPAFKAPHDKLKPPIRGKLTTNVRRCEPRTKNGRAFSRVGIRLKVVLKGRQSKPPSSCKEHGKTRARTSVLYRSS